MTTKFDILLADMNYKKNQMAKLRDLMREKIDELELEYESLMMSIEEFEEGIASTKSGIEYIFFKPKSQFSKRFT